MNGLFKDTLAELFDKKTVYLFFVITIISIVTTLLSGSFELIVNGAEKGVGLEDMGVDVDKPLLLGIQYLMSLLTFLAVMFSAGIIPNMFIKGRSDYYLSKPLSRASLLLKKFISVWVVYGVLVTGCGFLCYLSGAAVHSLFNYNIFMLIALVFIELFVWLSISFFIGIFTSKTVSVIMFLFMTWILQTGLLGLYSSQAIAGFGYEILGKIVDYLYFLLPKITEMSALANSAITDLAVLNSYVIYSTIGFGVVMLYITIQLFKRKNY